MSVFSNNFHNIQEQVCSSMLYESGVSSGKEILEFNINDSTQIFVKCFGSVVGRLKDIIKYHIVVKVTSAELVNISLESWLLWCEIFM